MSKTGIVALGVTQVTAQPIFAGCYYNQVATCTSAANGVCLPGAVTAQTLGNSTAQVFNKEIVIKNDGVAALSVYPPTGMAINSLAANTAFIVPSGALGKFTQISTTVAYGMISESGGGVIVSSTNTALAGGTMTAVMTTVPSNCMTFIVSVCAAQYDSIALPRSPALGVPYLIINNGALACAIFPTNTIADASVIDSIASNAGTAATTIGAYPLAAGARVSFTAVSNVAGLVQWFSSGLTGRRLQHNFAAAGTLQPQESGALIRVSHAAVYTITMPAPASGLEFDMVCDVAGNNVVTIDCGAGLQDGFTIGILAAPVFVNGAASQRLVWTGGAVTQVSDLVQYRSDGVHWKVAAFSPIVTTNPFTFT